MDNHNQLTTGEGVNAEVRAIMGRHRVNQTGLAEILGLPQSAISDRLNGKTSWRVDELDAVAAYFDIPITNLFPEQGGTSYRCTEQSESVGDLASV